MYLLNQANQAVRTELETKLRALSLTGIQYTVLSIVGSREGISSADLARRFYVTPQTMNQIVTGLERRQLIVRTASEANRRILTARLTKAGQAVLRSADKIADQVEQAAFATIEEAEFAGLRSHLVHLLEHLRTAHSQ